jgi:hypothetical protein
MPLEPAQLPRTLSRLDGRPYLFQLRNWRRYFVSFLFVYGDLRDRQHETGRVQRSCSEENAIASWSLRSSTCSTSDSGDAADVEGFPRVERKTRSGDEDLHDVGVLLSQ